jgi:hypothetical protein
VKEKGKEGRKEGREEWAEEGEGREGDDWSIFEGEKRTRRLTQE